MNKKHIQTEKTISDFGDQWSRYQDNQGWYGSTELFRDIITPLLDAQSLQDKVVADIGSGTGRIVAMLLEAGVKHVYAIEPSEEAFRVLVKNIELMKRPNDVTPIQARGEQWKLKQLLDYVFSIGVIHHIPDPAPVVNTIYQALKPGGYFFMWLYGFEGNEIYLGIVEPLRKFTSQLPHVVLRAVVELLYWLLFVYRFICKVIPLWFHEYITNVFWLLSPQKRRLVIYDQLNPAYAKYYRKNEAIRLLKDAGFINVKIHHRHGYSWSVIGQKPNVTSR